MVGLAVDFIGEHRDEPLHIPQRRGRVSLAPSFRNTPLRFIDNIPQHIVVSRHRLCHRAKSIVNVRLCLALVIDQVCVACFAHIKGPWRKHDHLVVRRRLTHSSVKITEGVDK